MSGAPAVPVVSLRGIHRVFGRGENAVHALSSVDLDVFEGDFLAVMGASGSGKSTCMNLIGCLDRPTAGRYFFCGVEVGSLGSDDLALIRRHRIGFVFQGFNLLSRTTALANVELPLIYQRVKKRDRRARAMEALAEVSGGQQQRTAIARALVARPKLLVADEPTGNLDSATKKEVMTLLRTLNEEQGITIVMVTHEKAMAAYARRKVEFLDGRLVRDSLNGGTADA
jgi:putative ABC transport system ATP-binding protein